MSSLILYFLESTICVLLLFLFYKLVLSSLTFFHWRRFYWLCGICLSLIIPALNIDISSNTSHLILYPMEFVDGIEDGVREEIFSDRRQMAVDKSGNIYWLWGQYALIALYLGVALTLFTRLITKLFSLAKCGENAQKEDFNGYRIIKSDQVKIPYTFLNRIYVPRDHSLNTQEYDFVLEHEKVHVFHRHTLDIIFILLVKAFFWFNPLYKFILKDMKLLHEYIADDHVRIKSSQTSSYAMLLLKLASSRSTPALVNNFSKLQIKERIIMLKQKKNQPSRKMRFLLSIPLIIFLIFSFSVNKKSAPKKPAEGMQRLFVMSSLLPDFAPVQNSKPFGYPLANEYRKVSSHFGMRIHPVHKVKKMHHGIDMPAPAGTPVYVTASGVVTEVKNWPKSYGKFIRIKHGEYETFYSQLSAFEVKVGDKVTSGQLIGRVGSSGLSTAPHLHYEVIKDGKRIDPEKTSC